MVLVSSSPGQTVLSDMNGLHIEWRGRRGLVCCDDWEDSKRRNQLAFVLNQLPLRKHTFFPKFDKCLVEMASSNAQLHIEPRVTIPEGAV